MAKIKLDFSGLDDLGIIQRCINIKTALTGNATFTTTTPTLTAFGALITAAQAKVTTAEMTQQAAKQATADKDAGIEALLVGVGQLADCISMTAAGDAVKIQSAGFSVKAPRTPRGVPAQVVNLSLIAGANDGMVGAQWEPVTGAKTYEVEVSVDPVTSSSWVTKPSVTKSKAKFQDLTSGTRVWVRVRAVNAAGQGAWSDPATKIVP